MDESVKDQLPEEYTDPKYLEELFDRIKEDNIGLHHKDCDNQCEKCKDLESLAWFADRFITCTLKNPDTRDLALNLQQHKHFPQSCKKEGDKLQIWGSMVSVSENSYSSATKSKVQARNCHRGGKGKID